MGGFGIAWAELVSVGTPCTLIDVSDIAGGAPGPLRVGMAPCREVSIEDIVWVSLLPNHAQRLKPAYSKV